jgi:NAD(P)-dependent dehydrogenase (short-subunit alcohol dehydrogenase family)
MRVSRKQEDVDNGEARAKRRHRRQIAATTPPGRIGTPDDIAAAIEACATHLTYGRDDHREVLTIS